MANAMIDLLQKVRGDNVLLQTIEGAVTDAMYYFLTTADPGNDARWADKVKLAEWLLDDADVRVTALARRLRYYVGVNPAVQTGADLSSDVIFLVRQAWPKLAAKLP